VHLLVDGVVSYPRKGIFMCPIDGLYDLHRHCADSSHHLSVDTART
jgi:hypothetical protein